MTHRRLLLTGVLTTVLLLPGIVEAQEATLSGTVTDTTSGALPGVTVRAVHEASGNSFESVTDARGDYRLAVRVGTYRLTADLTGFAPVTQTVTLLVGQQAVVNLQMSLSGVRESVTVTGEAPLLDVTQSSLGGNIDARQMEDLPVQGRNWIDLVMLAPGARVTAISDLGTPSDVGATGPSNARLGGDFNLNVDGQQITTWTSGGGKGQPRLSRDAIAEFEFTSGRFDATQGRSSGLQVMAVTKSGTNTPSGSFSGYFRDDRFNAADHVAKRVLPYQDQQLSGTFGGPLLKDKFHYFANYEYEREPLTFVYTTPYPHFNRDLRGTHTEKKAGGRLDAQFSSRSRLSVRGLGSWAVNPQGGGATSIPSATGGVHPLSGFSQQTQQLLTTLTQVLSNRAVNELKVGFAGFIWDRHSGLRNPNARFSGTGGPAVQLRGLTGGGPSRYPDHIGQDTYSVRDDLTYSFTKGGRHTVKLGAEYLHQNVFSLFCLQCEGFLQADAGPIPANIESLFPDLFDVSTWNLAPLSPISVRWRQVFAPKFDSGTPRYSSAAWVQDDWAVSPRLTLNLGLRYDLELNAMAQELEQLPFLPGGRPNDTNNVGPRTGFTFSLNDRTVIRGGYGLYFGTLTNAHELAYYIQTINLTVENDGRPDFASNPFNGPPPTHASLVQNLCTSALVPGCIRRDMPTGGAVYGPDKTIPYSHQSSIGVQRQIGRTMAIEADFVYAGLRNQTRDRPINLSFDPATGVNYRFSDISKRPYPDWGYISLAVDGARSNSHALQTAFTKRFSQGWQASGTYSLSVLRDAEPLPLSGLNSVPFKVAQDFGGEYGLAVTDQRHRATFNGIWQLPYEFQLSGLYTFGSGERFFNNWGTDLRGIGGIRPNELRLRPDGTIVPRNSFVGQPLHRVDLRLQRRFPLGGRAGIDGMLEVFNVFNHANFGSYVTQESFAARYGQPQQSTNVAHTPRALQLGFRFAF